MGLRSENAVLCKAGDAQIIVLTNETAAAATLVVGEIYRIFAPPIGVTAIGYSTPATIGNVIGVIGPGGWLDIRATATSLSIINKDTKDDYGTDFDTNAYVIKISDNA